jgi:signal transduction histidine kinase
MIKVHSLFSKILVSHIVIIIITISSVGLLLSHLVHEYFIEAKKNQLAHDGAVIASLLKSRPPSNMEEFLSYMGELLGVRLWLKTDSGEIIGDCPPPFRNTENLPHHEKGPHHNDEKHMAKDAPPDANTTTWVRKSPKDDDPSVISAVKLEGGELYLYTPIFGIAKTADAIETMLFYSIGAAIAAAVLTSFLIAKTLTRPIGEITRAAAAFAAGSYKSRAAIFGDDEIAKLGRDFNKMADSIEKTEKNRREFFASVAHELKTPLASVRLLGETLLDKMEESPAARDRYLATIIAETDHMSHAISEILDLERLECGSFSFNFTKTDLKALQENIAAKLQPLLLKKDLTLTADFSGSVQPIKTDAFRLEQILTNLLSNAIRHSKAGGTIKVLYDFSDKLTLSVIDNGEGITAEHLPHIWDRFYRVDKARARADGGTGLGLAITKQLCEGLGGTITVKSTPSVATVFTVTLNLK